MQQFLFHFRVSLFVLAHCSSLNNKDHFVFQSLASSAPLLYLQSSEVISQPVEIAQDGGCVPPPLSLMEASVPEVHTHLFLWWLFAQCQQLNPEPSRLQENVLSRGHAQLCGKVSGREPPVSMFSSFYSLKSAMKTAELIFSLIYLCLPLLF